MAASAVYGTSVNALQHTVPLSKSFASAFNAFNLKTCLQPQCAITYLVSYIPFHVLQYYNWLMGQCVARFGKPDTAKAHKSNPFPGLVSVLLQQR